LLTLAKNTNQINATVYITGFPHYSQSNNK